MNETKTLGLKVVYIGGNNPMVNIETLSAVSPDSFSFSTIYDMYKGETPEAPLRQGVGLQTNEGSYGTGKDYDRAEMPEINTENTKKIKKMCLAIADLVKEYME